MNISRNLVSQAIENGDLDAIESFYKYSPLMFSSLDCKNAVLFGRMGSLKKLVDLGCNVDWTSSAAAAATGNLDAFQYIFESGFEITSHCASLAALFGHSHILKFIVEKKLPIDWRANFNAKCIKDSDCLNVLKNEVVDFHLEKLSMLQPLDNCLFKGIYHKTFVSAKRRINQIYY